MTKRKATVFDTKPHESIERDLAIYWLGTSGNFLFDDDPHIARNKLDQNEPASLEDLWQAKRSARSR